jgi:hypothetical protein
MEFMGSDFFGSTALTLLQASGGGSQFAVFGIVQSRVRRFPAWG